MNGPETEKELNEDNKLGEFPTPEGVKDSSEITPSLDIDGRDNYLGRGVLDLYNKFWSTEKNEFTAFNDGSIRVSGLSKEKVLNLLGVDEKGNIIENCGLRFSHVEEGKKESSTPSIIGGHQIPDTNDLDQITDGSVVFHKDGTDKTFRAC